MPKILTQDIDPMQHQFECVGLSKEAMLLASQYGVDLKSRRYLTSRAMRAARRMLILMTSDMKDDEEARFVVEVRRLR